MMERKRPVVSMTISPSVIAELDELSKRTGRTRSDVAELCLIFGIERMRKEVELKEKVKEDEANSKEDSLEDRFLRKKIFDMRDNGEWVSVF